MLAGCAGDENEGTPALSAGEPLGVGGTLVWTVADPIETVDPLLARTRSERLVTRQIHEPLTATVTGPFGDTRRVPGLARGVRSSADDEIWTVRLRAGVQFQDGSPLNADAVLANAVRWQTTVAGSRLVPGLVDAFAPAPDIVRFILAGPDRRFGERLAHPALGIVSREALRPASGVGAEMTRARQTGTGAFELRESGPNRQLLARNTDWWGAATGSDLGPALEQAEFRVEPSSAVRLALLDAGDIQLADELIEDQANQALADPLLNALPGPGGTWLGLSRAVRGVDSAREIPTLSSVWLTNVTVAE
jgi:peptide/nickel transport system substrate-binding protein